MRRSPQERVTNDFAREICLREAEKAVLGGSIGRLGASYGIELKATACQTGATLARQQSQAADKDHVLQALARAARPYPLQRSSAPCAAVGPASPLLV